MSLGVTLPLFFSASLLLQPRGVFGSPAFSGTLGPGFGGRGALPGLAALRRARVGRGVFVAGRLHAGRFALELFTRRGQRLVDGAQDVCRLGLRTAEETGLLARRRVRSVGGVSAWSIPRLTFPGVKKDFISGGR